MKETEKNVTEKMEPVQANEPSERGWCVVASGLCADKTRIVIKSGYATKAEAEKDAGGAIVENFPEWPWVVEMKAVREPKRCKVVRMRVADKGMTDHGLLEPLETLMDEATWEEAKDAVEQNPDAHIVYPVAWTPGRKVAVAACALALVAAVGVGIAGGANRPVPVEANAPAVSEVQQTGAEQAEKSAVMLTVKAEGADASATKVKVVATGADGKAVVPETEVEANEATRIGRLPKGGYELHVTAAPVCADGSSYKLPEKPITFKVDGKGGDVKLDVKLERIAAEDMTKEQLEASAAALEEAGNASQAQEVKTKSESAVSQPGSESEIKRDPALTPTPNNGGNSGGSGSNNSDSSDSSNSGGGSDSGSTTPSNPTNPSAHEHSWTPVTKIVHHDAVYQTVHHDAVYDTIHHDAVTVCSGCGATFNDSGSYMAHDKEGIRNGTACGTFGYYVQSAYDEQILISDAYDEPVLESAAYDEQIVTGYVCSCGSTK